LGKPPSEPLSPSPLVCPRWGHLLHPGPDHTGQLKVVDIGFPKMLLDEEKVQTYLLETERDQTMAIRGPVSRTVTRGTSVTSWFSRVVWKKPELQPWPAKQLYAWARGWLRSASPRAQSYQWRSIAEVMTVPLPENALNRPSALRPDPILRLWLRNKESPSSSAQASGR